MKDTRQAARNAMELMRALTTAHVFDAAAFLDEMGECCRQLYARELSGRERIALDRMIAVYCSSTGASRFDRGHSSAVFSAGPL